MKESTTYLTLDISLLPFPKEYIFGKFVDMECIRSSYNRGGRPRVGYLFSVLGFMMLFLLMQLVLIQPVLTLIFGVARAEYAGLFVQGFVIFALPAWLVEVYYRQRELDRVWRLSPKDIVAPNLLAMLGVLGLGIMATYILSWLMELLPVPQIFQELERVTTEQYERMLTEREPVSRVLIWLGTVVAAPFGEELVFRGALMGWLLTRTRGEHTAVWVVALIFSLIHLQWTGMPARLLLGGMLGYIAIYGGLWMAILFHVLNNFLVFVIPDSVDMSGYGVVAIIVLVVVLVAITYLVKYMRSKAPQHGMCSEGEA